MTNEAAKRLRCALCGAYLSRPKWGAKWVKCGRCRSEWEVVR